MRLKGASTSQVIGTRNEWIWMIMMAKWYWGPWGPKASRHLSYRWGKTPKKPHPGNLSRPGIEPGPAAWQACMLPPCPQRWTLFYCFVTIVLMVRNHLPLQSTSMLDLLSAVCNYLFNYYSYREAIPSISNLKICHVVVIKTKQRTMKMGMRAIYYIGA